MKKLISLLLAVSVMTMSSSAFAAYLSADGQRNPGDNSSAVGGANSNVLRDYSHTVKHLAAYRPGDTLTFKKGDLTVNSGDTVTFVSSKLDATSLSNSTVMFIDQLTVDSSNPSFSYKIREGLADGIYKLDIKIGSQDVDTFYYLVGTPKVEILFTDENEKSQTYTAADGTTYYFASATIGSGDVMYEQVGVDSFGFKFGDNNYTFKAETFDSATNAQEIEGTVNWLFSIGVKDVTGDAPVAAGVIVDEASTSN